MTTILFMAILMVGYTNAFNFFPPGFPFNDPFNMIRHNFPTFPHVFPPVRPADVASRVPRPGEQYHGISVSSGSFVNGDNAEQTGGMTVVTNNNGVVKKFHVPDPPPGSSVNIPLSGMNITVTKLCVNDTSVKLQNISIPMPKLHNISIPMPKLQNINIPMPKLNNINIPMPKIPDLHISVPFLPNLNIPMPKIPNINIPMPQIPDINIPLPQIPDINITAPQLPNNINITIPETPSGEPVNVITMKRYSPNGGYYQQSMTYVGNNNGAGVASILQNVNGQINEEVIDYNQ